MHYDLPITIKKTLEWYNRIKKVDERQDFTIIENHRIVAMGGLTHIDHSVNKAELYIFVNPDLHHLGIGTKALNLICEYGFKKLSLNKIYLETNEDNIYAIKLYIKRGFIIEGKHRQEYINSYGEYKDRLYLGLLKSDLKQ